MTHFKADHWTELTFEEAEEWAALAPNFLPKELASKGNGSLFISKASLSKLQNLRDLYGKPLIINSAYRDPEHNKRVGSTSKSQHLQGRAFDIHTTDVEMRRELEKLAKSLGFTAIGRYSNFIHVDNRPPKSNGGGYRWGKW